MGAVALGFFIFGRTGESLTPLTNRTFSNWALAGSLVFGLMGVAAARAAAAHRKLQSVLLLAVGSLLFLNATTLGYQSYSPLLSSAALARKLRPMIRPDTPLFAVNYYDQTLPFYLKRTVTLVGYVNEFDMGERDEPQKWIHDLPAFERLWRELPQGVAVTNPAGFVSLRHLGLPMQIIDETTGRIVVRKPWTRPTGTSSGWTSLPTAWPTCSVAPGSTSSRATSPSTRNGWSTTSVSATW